jgi:hypothetical protein
MNTLSTPNNLPPRVDALIPRPPDGFQWALVRQEPTTVDRRRGYITKFDEKMNEKIEKFEYEKLTNMKSRIRLLKLMAGNQDTPDVECQLFEADIKDGKVFMLISGQPRDSGVVEDYEALSWSWGSEPPEYQILIRKGESRTRMRATGALVWAIKHLRYPDRDRTLWVDAICIDQGNVDEKNHQVQMMSQIYSYAIRVCIWLGLDDVESSRAIRFIKEEILQLRHFDTLCQDESNSQKWQSLLLLMQRPWFFRRWVVQEIALARDATIYCGPDEIAWKDFSVAVELFVEVETATHRLSEVMKKDPKFYHVPGWFEYVSALGASLLVEATGMIFRYYKQEDTEVENSQGNEDGRDKRTPQNPAPGQDEPVADGDSSCTEESDAETQDNSGSKKRKKNANRPNEENKRIKLDSSDDPISQRRPLLSLEYLVSKLTIFQATEPRDAIYALLAIARDTIPSARADDRAALQLHEALTANTTQKLFLVDYGRPYADVCQDFIEFCARRSDRTRALDILCRPWAPDPHPGQTIHFNHRSKRGDIETWLKSLALWRKLKKSFRKQRNRAQAHDLKLPSWIPILSGAPFAMYSQAGIHIMKMGRVNADPLVGLPHGPRSYDAAQGAEIDLESLKFKKRRLHSAHCMYIRGFILDTVQKTADSSQGGNIPVDWLKLSEWDVWSVGKKNQKESERDANKSGKDGDPPEAFWRTIVADRGKEGRNPPYYYARACKESVFKGGLASGFVNTSDLINNERNSIAAQFCRRVQSVIWNRSLIRTTQGHLGIANKDTAKGDVVAILYGCSVPVILRKRYKTKEQIEEEEEEEKFVQNAEMARRLISDWVRKIKRRKKWEMLPEEPVPEESVLRESVPGEPKKPAKWGKQYIRESRAKYLEILKEREVTRQENAQRDIPMTSRKKDAEIKRECYYEFLGECYIHGMMDGEAMARKSKHNEDEQKDPKDERFQDIIFELR